MPLHSYPATRGCPARHLMMPCQSLPDTRHRTRQLRWPAGAVWFQSAGLILKSRLQKGVCPSADGALYFTWIRRPCFRLLWEMSRVNKKNRAAEFQSLRFVRMVRVELTQANAHYPLKVACLPFHHIRISCENQVSLSLWDCKYRHCLVNSKIFSRFI